MTLFCGVFRWLERWFFDKNKDKGKVSLLLTKNGLSCLYGSFILCLTMSYTNSI